MRTITATYYRLSLNILAEVSVAQPFPTHAKRNSKITTRHRYTGDRFRYLVDHPNVCAVCAVALRRHPHTARHW